MSFSSWLIPIAYAATEADKTDTATTIGNILLALGVLVAAILLGVLLRKLTERSIRKHHGDSHQELVLLYGRIVLAITATIGVLVALQIAGAKLEWFAGALGVGLGLALQGVLGNFIAGIILLTQDKFTIGDYVLLGERDTNQLGSGAGSTNAGTITDISGRCTTLLGLDGGQISVPNLTMLSSKVTCYTKNPVLRLDIEIGVGYGTDFEKTSQLILDVVKKNHAVEITPAPIVLVKEVASSAVTLLVRFWVESRTKWWTTRSEITRDIFVALQSAGVDVPYPIRTLRVDSVSSDLLARQPDFLAHLHTIEAEKQKNFTAVPDETTQPVPASESTVTPATSIADTVTTPSNVEQVNTIQINTVTQ